jgi:hypothetical protein
MRPRIASKDAGAQVFKCDAVGRVSAVTTGVKIPGNRGRYPADEQCLLRGMAGLGQSHPPLNSPPALQTAAERHSC